MVVVAGGLVYEAIEANTNKFVFPDSENFSTTLLLIFGLLNLKNQN